MAINLEEDQVAHILKFYHRPVYREVTDYYKALDTLEEITVNDETIYHYTLPFQEVYINGEGYAVTYKEQTIENNNLYYKNPNDEYPEYINKLEWKRTVDDIPGSKYWEEE